MPSSHRWEVSSRRQYLMSTFKLVLLVGVRRRGERWGKRRLVKDLASQVPMMLLLMEFNLEEFRPMRLHMRRLSFKSLLGGVNEKYCPGNWSWSCFWLRENVFCRWSFRF
uniref:Uncharacterized protein MANES_08G155900 n=2 Tax=Rhizophora mucronata TaxID=61149 RepID=A0A2P2MD89_RHIMU